MKLREGDEIGSGAIGRVVELIDDAGGTDYAGKYLHDSHLGDSGAQARFASEGALLENLDHPNVVRVYGIQDVLGRDVLVMERIRGDSLATLIARSAPLSEMRIIALTRGIAAGLAAAHRAGLIHRDLKPANVLVTARDDTPKIVDFGMARASSFASIGEHALAVVGTPAYMAPESTEPLSVDARTDLYALGCMMFEMATGRPPYGGATSFAVLENHMHAAIPDLPAEMSDSLSKLIRALLAKSSADRPQAAETVVDALEAMTKNSGVALARRELDPHGVCASCGGALIAGVGVCFGCGEEQPKLTPGPFSVFVTGPGVVASKLDITLRQALLDWLRGNPGLGLEPTSLVKRVPRLPFVLAVDVSETSASQLLEAVGRLGLEGHSVQGGRFSLPAVRSKAWKLTGRATAIILGSSAYMWTQGASFVATYLGIAVLGGGVRVWLSAGQRPTRQGGTSTRSLPASIETSLERVTGVLPAITESRHRENLRAVVQRVLDLRAFFEERGIDDFDAELATLIDVAVVASSGIDEIEAGLDRKALRSANDDLRALLVKRDMWASRLMATTAELESLRARYVAAELAGRARDELAALDDLRTHIEALREVEQL